jgi:hypothetical protein
MWKGRGMQLFMLAMSLGIASAARADTQLSCEGMIDGVKIQYRASSYRPCVGFCIGAPDPAAVLTTTNPLDENVFEVRTTTNATIRILDNPGVATTTRITQVSQLIGDTLDHIAPEDEVRTETTFFRKKQTLAVEVRSPLIPGGVVKLGCEQVKEASNQKEL